MMHTNNFPPPESRRLPGSVNVPHLLLIAALLLMPVAAHCQGIRITQPAPDCDIRKRAFDNPFSDTKGYTQPRVLWHAEFALGSYAIAWSLDELTAHRLPRWMTATIAAVGIGVVPHVRSIVIQRRYDFNPGDVAFDAVNRMTPYVWSAGHSDDSTRSWMSNHWKPAAVWLAADLSLACFSSP